MNDSVALDLSTMEGLNDEVRRSLTALSASMANDSDKASLGITINLARIKDTATMLEVTYKVTPRFPAKSRKIIAHADLTNNLHIDATPVQRNLIDFPQEVGSNV